MHAHFLQHTHTHNINRWIGPACPLLLILAFWCARFSDPGFITQPTLHHHACMYPHDGALWTAKQCEPCGWVRPARAKHCDVCGRCVARHDHHCVWINNCVGLGNTVHFITFLAANVAICAYGPPTTYPVHAVQHSRHNRNMCGAGVRGGRAQAAGHLAPHGVGRCERPTSAPHTQAAAACLHCAEVPAPRGTFVCIQ